MKTKVAVFACLLFVSVFVIASAVSEGNQEKVEAENGNPLKESKFRCRYKCCKYYGGDCVKCCDRPPQASQLATNQNDDLYTNEGDEESEVEANRFVGGRKGHKGTKGGKGSKGGKGGGKGGKGGKGK